MMDEMDTTSSSSSSTTRLRRRSFFENIDSDPSAFAPPPLDGASSSSHNDKDSASTGASSGAGALDSDHNMSSSSDRAALSAASTAASSSAHAPSPASTASGASAPGHGYRGGVAGALAQWLLASVLTLLYWLKMWLLLRWQRLRLHEQPPFRYIQVLRERSAAAAAVKHWAYPTQWLTLGCVSLVLAQVVVYWHFQLQPFDLHVKECVFHEQLMPSMPTKDAAVSGSSAPAMRYLERRFEQLHTHVGLAQKKKKSQPRLPWTCIAIVSTGAPHEATYAHDLAFLLPRSRVLEPATAGTVASRLQLAVGASPLERTEHAGVLGALFPLSAFRRALFPQGFPDLVLVKTEFALKRLVKYRQERQEELHHNVQRAGDADAADPAHHELSRSQFGIFLTKTTVPDIYNRRVVKHWDAFLHVVVVSEQDKKEQFTKELLTTWLQHPEWPTLHVRFERSLALCGSYVRFLSSVQSDAADHHREDDGDDDDEYRAPANIDVVCDADANTRSAIVLLKNQIGMHLFPTPPETEAYEEVALESIAVGAMVITYNTPITQEWIPDACGLRVGTFELPPHRAARDDERTATAQDAERDDAGAFAMPIVKVTASEIERAVASFLALDRVNRVATGRAARLQYLRMRTHYLSAVAALDTAVCDDDNDDAIEVQSEIGHRSRKTVEVETLRVFLY